MHFGQSVYVILNSAEGQHALLDPRFPELSSTARTLSLRFFTPTRAFPFRSLSVSQCAITKRDQEVSISSSVFTTDLLQTYCVMYSKYHSLAPPDCYKRSVLFQYGR